MCEGEDERPHKEVGGEEDDGRGNQGAAKRLGSDERVFDERFFIDEEVGRGSWVGLAAALNVVAVNIDH